MSTFSKFVLIALTAVGSVAASAHGAADARSFKAKSVIASHEAVPALTPVVHHPRHVHHRHHHVRPVHRAR